MEQLKRLSHEGIAGAIKKAEHYRLLNEARAAESICLDVLEIEPTHQAALILLLLSRTDQFAKDSGARVEEARHLLPALEGAYDRAYYAGIICERWAKAQLSRAVPGSGTMAYDWLREAMDCYAKAEQLRPAGDDDPILRWNACVRLIERHERIRPAHDDDFRPMLE